ncbi:L-ribulose-5-phosphate 3-epimerase [Candidatus Cetobacterium colombiensis]|uniref:L-ribulose-5-phosphate 3-epimerase n=1 Tax=Candidatus Cetobacterium colombiensis TaxID=3073100 RepID=A0ABU4WCI7_9FUSO|nr:L-ribulose-5-phosphate 3-epimerase [Candidatus Cetobacterium colombiensis]MDX8337248.1 L-ribulose-5-phosphate 3-epimerase [Candidatus Cetobacterium colombiensis]
MYDLNKFPLGIYEKALPKNIGWRDRLKYAKDLGFDFVEISIDETDERLARLDWTLEEREELLKVILEIGVRVPSMCFSGHRRFPLGSKNEETRKKSLELMKKAIELAVDLGIRNIQMAGYDVYYEEGDKETRELYIEGMKQSLKWAEQANVMLSIEIMDHPFMNSITKYLEFDKILNSPFLTVYPDVGNLTAWGNDVRNEVLKGKHKISAIHLKDTLAVTKNFPGKFKEVTFGEGCVDFVEFFKLLKEINYNGPLLIEMWTEKSENPLKEIEKAKIWIEEKMKKGGFIC